MDITITPGILRGSVRAIPSKSHAHRLLICSAFADAETTILCPNTSRDIEATVGCLNALGADIRRTENGYIVAPVRNLPKEPVLACGESGSTLRFMLPIAGALGIDATFLMEGRLSRRPLSPLWEEMERMGCTLTRPSEDTIHCTGQLKSGAYTIDGSISSQFVTGLLLALPLLQGDSQLSLTGNVESRPYIDITLKILSLFGVAVHNFSVKGKQIFHSPGSITVEGDWSNAAFFLAAAALGNPVTVENLNPDSAHGDRIITELLPQLQKHITISAANCPDLVPVLSIVAAANQGAVFTDVRRLRLKESDRVAAIAAMIEALGGKAASDENTLTVFPAPLQGGKVDACNDHRIAMAAAIAATICREPVTILGAECVQKSYPRFWDVYKQLGGQI